MKKYILFSISIALLLIGCSNEKSGSFQLYMTDTPLDGLEHAYVCLSQIAVKKQGSEDWRVIFEDAQNPKEFDLLALRDREDLVLNVDLDAGTYAAIKILISGARIVVNGNTIIIQLANPREVIIAAVFTVIKNDTTEVVLDFDAESSFSLGVNGQYLLVPVIVIKRIGY